MLLSTRECGAAYFSRSRCGNGVRRGRALNVKALFVARIVSPVQGYGDIMTGPDREILGASDVEGGSAEVTAGMVP